jgi:NhaP-type Na+/H+ or K+/H+ antiporter
MGFTEQTRQALAVTRVRCAAVWDKVQFAANGVISVLLGKQMPGILGQAGETVRLTGHAEPWWLAAYVLVIRRGCRRNRGLLRLLVTAATGQIHLVGGAWNGFSGALRLPAHAC